MTSVSYHAYIAPSSGPVRTFNNLDLAERYRDRMAVLGAEVRLQRVPPATTEEIEHELAERALRGTLDGL